MQRSFFFLQSILQLALKFTLHIHRTHFFFSFFFSVGTFLLHFTFWPCLSLKLPGNKYKLLASQTCADTWFELFNRALYIHSKKCTCHPNHSGIYILPKAFRDPTKKNSVDVLHSALCPVNIIWLELATQHSQSCYLLTYFNFNHTCIHIGNCHIQDTHLSTLSKQGNLLF